MILKNNPVAFLTRKVWEYSKENRKNVILYLSLFIIANTIAFFEPLIVAKLLNVIQEQGLTSTSVPILIKIALLFIVLNVSFSAFHGPARYLERKNAFLVRANYKKYLLDGTLDLPSEWHTDHHSGDTIDKIEKSTTALYTYSGRTYEVIETLIRFVGSYFALAYFNLHSAYIVLFGVIFIITMIIKFDNFLSKQYKLLFKTENQISAKIYDVISNITTVIILRIEKMLSNALFKKIMSPFKLYAHNLRVNELKWFLVAFCTSIMTFFVIITFVFSNYNSGTVIMVGTLYALYGYVQRINVLFFRFAYRYGEIVRQKSAVENVEELSREFKKKENIRSIKLDNNWNEIKIEDLNFSYIDEEKGELHLKDISFLMKRGERIALIGESGGGKSTILRVLRGLYKAETAKVYIDDKVLKDKFEAINDNITLIPQDPEIFTSTIRENITFGLPYKKEHIWKIIDLACFTDVVAKLPNKLESSIVEKGVNLSGGEKQRLALARGLLAAENKSIVFLDEPTSSVDSQNELKIYNNIFEEFKDKTIISSVHRLHLLRLFDRIYLFRGGKVKASGTFRELIQTSREFRTMWRNYNQSMEK